MTLLDCCGDFISPTLLPTQPGPGEVKGQQPITGLFAPAKMSCPALPEAHGASTFPGDRDLKLHFPTRGGLLRAPSQPTPGLGGPLESYFPPFFKGKALFEQIFFLLSVRPQRHQVINTVL